jgi:hypothetical protein
MIRSMRYESETRFSVVYFDGDKTALALDADNSGILRHIDKFQPAGFLFVLDNAVWKMDLETFKKLALVTLDLFGAVPVAIFSPTPLVPEQCTVFRLEARLRGVGLQFFNSEDTARIWLAGVIHAATLRANAW